MFDCASVSGDSHGAQVRRDECWGLVVRLGTGATLRGPSTLRSLQTNKTNPQLLPPSSPQLYSRCGKREIRIALMKSGSYFFGTVVAAVIGTRMGERVSGRARDRAGDSGGGGGGVLRSSLV